MNYIDNNNPTKGVKIGVDYVTRATGIIVKNPEETGIENTYGVYSNRLFMLTDVAMGALDTDIQIDTSKCKNSQTKTIGSKSLSISNYILLPMEHHNNMTVSTLVKGMKVVIDLIDRDVESFRITPINFDMLNSKQSQDIFEIFVPATENEKQVLTEDNSYRVKLDSKNKMISISTSMDNGETHAYKLIFNGHNGMMSLTDNEDRAFSIVSSEDTIKMKNKAGAFISLVEGDITIEGSNLIVNLSNGITVNSTDLVVENDNTSLKTSRFVGEMDNYESRGTKFKSSYDSAELNGSKYNLQYDSTILKATAVTCTGEFNCKNILLDYAMEGSRGLPTSPSATTMLTNVKGPGGMPVVLAPALMAYLTLNSTLVDSLCALIGVPPSLSTLLGSSAPQLQSTCLMG